MLIPKDGEYMIFVYGLLSGVAFLFYTALLLYVGFKLSKKHSIKLDPVTEEEKREAAKVQKHFSKLMTYDVSKALERKKVD